MRASQSRKGRGRSNASLTRMPSVPVAPRTLTLRSPFWDISPVIRLLS